MVRLWICAGIVLASACLAWADEVQFVNGDKLTGKVVAVEGGKMAFESATVGAIKIDMARVKTFSTDAPIDIRLKDGTTLKQKALAGEAGTITTEGGMTAKQSVAFANLKAINPPPQDWTGNVLVGGLLTRGNSETEQLDLRAKAVRRTDNDRITGEAGYNFGRQKDQDTGSKTTTTDSWFVDGKYDYFMTEKWYWYGKTRIERDRVADLDLRLSPSVGVGYQWVERPDFNVSTEAGLGWVFEDYATGESNDYIAGRLAYHIDKKLNDKVTLFHNVEYLPSLESLSDYNINADAGLRTALTSKMFAEFKIEVKHDSNPAPGADKTDLRYVLSVGWEF